MRLRGLILVLAVLFAGLSMGRSAEAFGGKKRGYAYSYSGAGGHWVAPAPVTYGYAPAYGGYSGGGMPGSGYGGGYYGLQGYNHNAWGPGMPGYPGYGYGWGGLRR
jgi:hypothetical protein